MWECLRHFKKCKIAKQHKQRVRYEKPARCAGTVHC